MKCGKLIEYFRLMKKNVFVLSLVSILMCLLGCDLWYQDWKGYMEHWSGNVQVSDVSVQASPEMQKNSSGIDTISSYATVVATVNISNPANYSLDNGVGLGSESLRSVRIAGAAGSSVFPLVNITSCSSTSMEVQIAPLAQGNATGNLSLEHTNFTVTFIPTRTENGYSATDSRTITLRYNTPPRSPMELVYDTNQQKLTWLNSNSWDIVQGTGTALDDLIFWAWPSGITEPTHPDYVEKFEVYEDGELFDSATAADFLMSNESTLQSYIPQEIKAAGYDIYCSLGTSGKTITVCAVDNEGVRSQMATSGIAPHKIILDTNGGLFSSGSNSAEIYKAHGSLIYEADLDVPSRTGYSFAGWRSSIDKSAGFPLSVDQPMTLVAQWNLNQDVDGKYIVTDHEALFWIAEQLEDGAITKFDLKLTADIVIPSNTWEPISVIESSVDGQGYSITLEENFIDSEGERFGLFGHFNYGTVENLVLKGSITAQVEPGEAGVGAVSGTAYRTTLRNVMSEVKIINTGTGSAGGLVGYFGGGDATALIENCAVYADVTSTNGNAGGLVGATWGGNQWWSIRSSIYMGNITGSTKGAIIGSQGTVGGNTAYMSDIWYCERGGLSTDIGAMPGAVSISGSRGIKKTAEEIKNDGVTILGSAWELKSGGNYPTLKQP